MAGVLTSMPEIRAQVHRLPRERRKDIGVAMREGRAVADPRDAALAVAWAEHLESVSWPRWLMPRRRPKGPKAWLWILHAVTLTALSLWALSIILWPLLPGSWRWVVLVLFVAAFATTPITVSQMLRSFWNAPDTAARNRALLEQN